MRIFIFLGLVLAASSVHAATTLDFYIINVAQGNATLIVAPTGETMLLDAGPKRMSDHVIDVLKSIGIRQLDYLVVSHYHEDHFGGAAAVASEFKVVNFLDHGSNLESGKSEDWRKTLKEQQYKPDMGTTYDRWFAEYAAARKTSNHTVGGSGDLLKQNIADLRDHYKGRFLVCTEPTYARYPEPGYRQWQADQLVRDKQAGGVGLKVLKSLGLFLRTKGFTGELVKVDDPKFDPMWEAAGALGLPVSIHTADPNAFFTPSDRFNERYDSVYKHPDWSFYGQDFPTKKELLDALNRVIARHPRTTFVSVHVCNNAENLDESSEWMRRYPNMHCELAARISELGRQPRRSRKFFDEFQDRIMLGTDGGGLLGVDLYSPYFRFLETEDEYFDYWLSPAYNQGRWKIYGIGLPDSILKKVYHNNAARMYHLTEI